MSRDSGVQGSTGMEEQSEIVVDTHWGPNTAVHRQCAGHHLYGTSALALINKEELHPRKSRSKAWLSEASLAVSIDTSCCNLSNEPK